MNSDPYSTDAQPEQLVSEILTQFQAGGAYPRDHVERITTLAISEDRRIAERASGAFFGSLVETLADSFEASAVSLYNQAFAQLIQACRNAERGRPLDEELREFGLQTEADVVARAEGLRTSWQLRHPFPSGADHAEQVAPERFQPGRVIVLSRVTLGADVAITSVIIERLKTTFPAAEIVLVGGRKAAELFGGDRRLAFKEITYPRGATALARLLAWLPLLECVRELTEGVERSVIVDPDSRLSQLGLLPLKSDLSWRAREDGTRYLFFPSREYREDSSASLSELTSAWLDEVLGSTRPVYPSVSLQPADLEAARSFTTRIRRERHPIITLNFGVGGNKSKRVGDGFERQLVSSLLRDGATVVLDKGAGADEAKRAEAVIEFAIRSSNDRLRTIELEEASLPRLPGEDRMEAELVVWSGRIGLLAGLIGESDLYIGYDSAGQHIAAAMGVPCVDVFAGFSSRRILDRWRPTGRAETRSVVAERSMTEDEVLGETLRHARELLDRRS